MKTTVTRLGLAVTWLGLTAGAPGRAEASQLATLSLQSQPGDFIGQGQTVNLTYTPQNSQSFFVEPSQYINGTPSYIAFILGTVTSSNATNTYTGLAFSTA